jgi:hypothetical protein
MRAMRKSLRLVSLAGFLGLTQFSFLAVPGCSDSNQTGTTVQRTPEAIAGEKASMEFMQKNMAKGGYMPKK